MKTNYEKLEWERDPVCGDRINIHDAKGMSLYKESRYYFCCKICKKIFDENPSAYADKEEGDPRTIDNIKGWVVMF